MEIEKFQYTRTPVSEWASKEVGEKYTMEYQVGRGTFGDVFKARSTLNSEKYFAIKVIKNEDEKDGFPITALKEIEALRKIDHPNVIKMVEISTYRTDLKSSNLKTCIVFEYMEHDLGGIVNKKIFKLSLDQIKSLMKQVLEGINAIHKAGFIHRDIKWDNILYGSKGNVKICDFGQSTKLSHKQNLKQFNVQNQKFKAPELFLEVEYNEKVDIWSLGILFAYILLDDNLFQIQKTSQEQIEHFCEKLGSGDLKDWKQLKESNSKVYKDMLESANGELNYAKNLYKYIKNKKNVDDDAIDLLENMLKLNPNKRFSAEECLNHKFFEGLDPEEDALPRIQDQEYHSMSPRNIPIEASFKIQQKNPNQRFNQIQQNQRKNSREYQKNMAYQKKNVQQQQQQTVGAVLVQQNSNQIQGQQFQQQQQVQVLQQSQFQQKQVSQGNGMRTNKFGQINISQQGNQNNSQGSSLRGFQGQQKKQFQEQQVGNAIVQAGQSQIHFHYYNQNSQTSQQNVGEEKQIYQFQQNQKQKFQGNFNSQQNQKIPKQVFQKGQSKERERSIEKHKEQVQKEKKQQMQLIEKQIKVKIEEEGENSSSDTEIQNQKKAILEGGKRGEEENGQQKKGLLGAAQGTNNSIINTGFQQNSILNSLQQIQQQQQQSQMLPIQSPKFLFLNNQNESQTDNQTQIPFQRNSSASSNQSLPNQNSNQEISQLEQNNGSNNIQLIILNINVNQENHLLTQISERGIQNQINSSVATGEDKILTEPQTPQILYSEENQC